MKNITESFNNLHDINRYLNDEERIDEGLREIFDAVKTKFKQVFVYLKGVVAKFGNYFLPVSKEGFVIPVITPLTAGASYTSGAINKKSTFVKMDKEGAKITGCKTKFDDALKLYGKGNSISYWNQILTESSENDFDKVLESAMTINEVSLHTEDPEAQYNIVVDDTDLKNEIKMCLNDPKQARLLIWGAPGIGKTAILLNIISEMKSDFPDYRLIVKTLSNETPDNFTLPKYVEDMSDDDFKELSQKLEKEETVIKKLFRQIGGTKAIDVPKTWLPVYKPTGDAEVDAYLDEKCGKGLLFIDELSRATAQVLNVILPLINEGSFNGYVLGSGWTIICASNRSQDEEGGQEKLGNALSNRFFQLHYEPTVKTWRKWADKQNFISPLLLQWLSMPENEDMSGGKFYYMDPNEDSSRIADTTLICTPRSWTNAMRRLARYHHTGKLEGFNIFDIPTNVIQRALNGCVPKSAVDGFMAFLNVISKIGNFDQAVHDIWKNDGKGFNINKKHLNLVALPLAQLVCCAKSGSLPTVKEFESLTKWLVAQNSDQLASYVLDVFQNVFLSDIEPQLRGQFFYIQDTIKEGGKMVHTYESAFSKFCNRWGIKFEDIPDYGIGLDILVEKYGESFESAVIDGKANALG